MEKFTVAILALLCLLMNVPLGRWRTGYKRFSIPWFILIHASVPAIIALRLWLEVSHVFIPLFIALAVVGQYVGKRTVKV